MSPILNRDPKNIPALTVFLASGAAANAAEPAGQRVALKGRKKTKRTVKVEDGREEEY